MTGCGADELASTYYAARLPVDLGGEQHPSRLIRARLPRGGKKEHAQARQRRQHLLPFMLPYVRPTYNIHGTAGQRKGGGWIYNGVWAR